MSYPFIIRHSLPGRTRIRWSGDSDERAQVEALAPQIAELPGVDKTDARPQSGSIVIEHETIEWGDLEPRLQTECGIEFASAKPSRSGLDSFNLGVGVLERELGKNDIDLRSLVFLFLMVMAVAQAARGQYGASGFSFLWYALSVATHRRDSGTTATPPLGDNIRPI